MSWFGSTLSFFHTLDGASGSSPSDHFLIELENGTGAIELENGKGAIELEAGP